ncbi:MAG: hypothetical protein JSS27_17840 [Planctomycetes bacterium]|nr:hypothetical protein [Planctomycetota bacterium]
MSKADSKGKQSDKISVWQWLARVVLRSKLLAVAAIVGAIFMVGRAVIDALEPHLRDQEQFLVKYDDIYLSPAPPAWIRTDIKREALRGASLDQPTSILANDLVARVGQAFELHPWVEKVVEVRKSAQPRVDVKLAYRRPVCMIEVPGGLYAIDARAVLLPSVDFTAEDARIYPRLSGIRAVTEGPVGTVWQDSAVTDAAEIASLLLERWTQWGLVRITVRADANQPVAGPPEFILETANGSQVTWGRAPRVAKNEPSLEEKLARLATEAQAGRLTTIGQARDFDLRQRSTIVETPRNARDSDKELR